MCVVGEAHRTWLGQRTLESHTVASRPQGGRATDDIQLGVFPLHGLLDLRAECGGAEERCDDQYDGSHGDSSSPDQCH